MKKILIGSVAAGLLALGLGFAAAQDGASAPTETTLTGEVVDLSCYMAHGAKGADHRECALKCFQGGSPAGLLTADGSLYVIVNHAGKIVKALQKKAGEQVTVSAEIMKANGLQAIEVKKIAK